MPNLSNWYANDRLSPVDAEDRAIAAWRRISDRASSIVLYRNGVAQAAQTVRIEWDDRPEQQIETAPARASERKLTVFGVKDHPTEADTVIMVDDLFNYNGLDYRVNDVITPPGEVQASAERFS